MPKWNILSQSSLHNSVTNKVNSVNINRTVYELETIPIASIIQNDFLEKKQVIIADLVAIGHCSATRLGFCCNGLMTILGEMATSTETKT